MPSSNQTEPEPRLASRSFGVGDFVNVAPANPRPGQAGAKDFDGLAIIEELLPDQGLARIIGFSQQEIPARTLLRDPAETLRRRRGAPHHWVEIKRLTAIE